LIAKASRGVDAEGFIMLDAGQARQQTDLE